MLNLALCLSHSILLSFHPSVAHRTTGWWTSGGDIRLVWGVAMSWHQWHLSTHVANLLFQLDIWWPEENLYGRLWSYFHDSADLSEPILPSGGILLSVTFMHLYHGSCWPVGYPGTCSWHVYLLLCSFIFSEWYPNVFAVEPSEVDQWIDLGISDAILGRRLILIPVLNLHPFSLSIL